MHNSMCDLKLTCLLCARERDFQSDYRKRTSKKTNVSFNKTQFRKAYIWNTGRGNGATGVHQSNLWWIPGRGHQAFSDGPQEGRRSTKCTTVFETGNSHACFAIANWIIEGVLAKKKMSASTKRNLKSVYLEDWNTGRANGATGVTRESPSSILSSEQKF